ncbi:MAG: TolC family protein [Bacteroidales bacterium]|nr:TolC family protein [Bacteroidales bacterium]
MIRLKLRICLIIISTLFWGLYSFTNNTIMAQDSPLTLEQCISIALNDNPIIKSSQDQFQAALARVNQAKAFSQPSLSLDADLQPEPLAIGRSGESYIGVSKSVLFPGKRKVNAAIATKASNEVLMDCEILKLNLIYQVKMAFYRLILNQEHLKFVRQNKDLAQDFLKKTKVKFEAGDAAQVEVLRAQVEVAKAASEIETTSNELIATKTGLNFLLGRDRNSTIKIIGKLNNTPLLLDLKNLKNQAFLNRPEINKIKLSLKKELLVKKQAGFSYLPDFDLGFSRHTIVGESKTWDMTVAMPIPLFFSQTVKGEIAESKANYNSLESELKNLQNFISLEVENAYRNALTAQNMINLFDKDMIQQSKQVYQMLLFSYQGGEISGIDLIEARKTLIDTEKSYGDALFNYNAALVSIEKSIGQSLENK